jgi:hypothetical protein
VSIKVVHYIFPDGEECHKRVFSQHSPVEGRLLSLAGIVGCLGNLITERRMYFHLDIRTLCPTSDELLGKQTSYGSGVKN